jgi:predicted nucleic acid-binding protein
MARFVLDTNVFLHAIRDEAARRDLAAWQRRMAPHIHQHAVAVAEILVGAKDREILDRWHRRWILPAERLGRVFTPDYGAWKRATGIMVNLLEAGALHASGIRGSFFNDCLLAASGRDHGFTIVTHNVADFELIASVEPHLRVEPPFP